MPDQTPTENIATDHQTTGEQQEQPDKNEGLKSALEKERHEKRETQRQLAQLKDQLKLLQETSPREVEEAQRKVEAAEQAKQLLQVQFENRIKEERAGLEQQLQQVTTELQARAKRAELEALRVQVRADFIASEGLTDESPLDGSTPFDPLWQMFNHRIGKDDQGLFILDREGKFPEINKDTGKRVTMREFFTQLRSDPVHGNAFKPRYGSGGGSRSGRDGRIDITTDLTSMSPGEALKLGLASLK